MTTRRNTRARILDRIAEFGGCTSIALLSSDLRVSVPTVTKHVRALESDGRVTFGWDGNALEITDSERIDREQNEQIRRTLKKI